MRSAQPLEDYWLGLTLTDASVVDRNVRELIHGPVFERLLTDYERFREVRTRWGTVSRRGGLDLDPDVLIWNGPPPKSGEDAPLDRLVLSRPSRVARATV